MVVKFLLMKCGCVVCFLCISVFMFSLVCVMLVVRCFFSWWNVCIRVVLLWCMVLWMWFSLVVFLCVFIVVDGLVVLSCFMLVGMVLVMV